MPTKCALNFGTLSICAFKSNIYRKENKGNSKKPYKKIKIRRLRAIILQWAIYVEKSNIAMAIIISHFEGHN